MNQSWIICSLDCIQNIVVFLLFQSRIFLLEHLLTNCWSNYRKKYYDWNFTLKWISRLWKQFFLFQDILNKLHLNVENRQYEINAVLSVYVSLEKEAKNDQLSLQVQEFKERWLKLRSQLRLCVSGLPLENSIQNRNGNGTSIGDGPGSTASVSSCETTHETQASRTTYYNSQVETQRPSYFFIPIR